LISTQNFRVEHGLQVGDVVIDAASGIVSATSFFGDGSGLTGVGGSSGAIIACCTSNFISCNTSLPSITSAENNFFVGFNAGNCITSGSDNNFFGRCAGLNNITGCNNNFFGVGAGQSNTTGKYNNFFGAGAGFGNTTGSSNNFFGFGAGVAVSGCGNNFFGIFAGSSLLSVFGDGEYNSGCANNFFGSQSGILNTTGCNNNFFGNLSGAANTTGSNNNFFGFGAGSNNTTGSYNIAIGHEVQLPNVSGNNQLAIGVSNTSWINGDENFNIGIGTTSPQAKFHSYGVYDTLDTVLGAPVNTLIEVKDSDPWLIGFRRTDLGPTADVAAWIDNDRNFLIGNGLPDGGFRNSVGLHTEYVKLYAYDQEKFSTIGAGATVIGTLFANQLSVSGVVTATSFVGDGSGLTNLPTPSRITVTGITEIISSSGIGNTDISGFKTYSILKVGISTAAWIRIYTDSDSRSNDASRPINIDPTSGSGIVAEFVSAGATTIKTGPVPIGYNDNDPEENIIYMSVNNLSGISTSIEVNLTILKMEE
jgi:hypothetical protein